MINVLKRWYHILAMKPLADEVLLIQEGDKVLLVPKYYENNHGTITAALSAKR